MTLEEFLSWRDQIVFALVKPGDGIGVIFDDDTRDRMATAWRLTEDEPIGAD